MLNPLKEGERNEHWRTLPELCMALHMRHTFADETLTDEQYDEAVAYLKSRVESWRPILNGPQNYCFDTAVLSLCLITIDEGKRVVRPTPASHGVL